jgi:hypothetical protein
MQTSSLEDMAMPASHGQPTTHRSLGHRLAGWLGRLALVSCILAGFLALVVVPRDGIGGPAGIANPAAHASTADGKHALSTAAGLATVAFEARKYPAHSAPSDPLLEHGSAPASAIALQTRSAIVPIIQRSQPVPFGRRTHRPRDPPQPAFL